MEAVFIKGLGFKGLLKNSFLFRLVKNAWMLGARNPEE